MLPAARRFVVLLAAATVVVGGAGAVIGLAFGSSAGRAAATALYLVGSFLIVLGVFNGLRGPVRPKGGADDQQPIGGVFGVGIFATGIRAASADERADARATTWLFLALGLSMVAVAVLIDPRTDLF